MDHRLSEAEAADLTGERSFTAGPPHRVGVELEWLVRDAADPGRPIAGPRSDRAIGPLEAAGTLPGGGKVTREPGGQVELSSRPAEGLAACIGGVETDLALVRSALARRGLAADGDALDAGREPLLVVDRPRYRAMAAYFDGNRSGMRIMCSTASIQINLDAGEETGRFGYRRRWALAHRLGPVLTAAFANSPLLDGRPTGWKSTRQASWARLDPGRTRAVDGDDDPRRAWARYALDARLLCLRREPPADWSAPHGLTFRRWLRGRCTEREPTVDDLIYHLSTLFPPVRPRGWLELRMVDAQEGDDWIVPLAVATMLFDDPDATAAAWEATEPLTRGRDRPSWTLWLRAARIGLADPALREAARACFAAASAALQRGDAPDRARDAVAEYGRRYIEPGRCPADDRLAADPSPPVTADLEVRS
ncbi:ergothioneine biosynthesis glutamate--cysteine ligase EgtA [Glycomyces xiaoerkulensis]|uniref:ergothioneine biosynthesis glutamate--cysteine ligase EgtA n=1 Tax=Glycomyces xiaoerkulensis TaxID=2038139 RepID=UPI000C2699C8|nr:ergothioneine biosynthesis glutamate--cysteine ligase EgtA [Glycomyces xiaoerkulensis]